MLNFLINNFSLSLAYRGSFDLTCSSMVNFMFFIPCPAKLKWAPVALDLILFLTYPICWYILSHQCKSYILDGEVYPKRDGAPDLQIKNKIFFFVYIKYNKAFGFSQFVYLYVKWTTKYKKKHIKSPPPLKKNSWQSRKTARKSQKSAWHPKKYSESCQECFHGLSGIVFGIIKHLFCWSMFF